MIGFGYAYAQVNVKAQSGNGKSKMKKELPNTFASPDFAFPETVEINAEKELKGALERDDDIKALRAGMQLVIARDLVSNNNYTEGLNLFEELEHKLKAPYSQLASLLKAQIYLSIYQSSPWTFNDRAIPVAPVPENVMEWSKDIFANTISGIVEGAFADVESARATPINAISSIIENREDAEKLDMTVYDFLTLKAGDLLDNFSDNNADAIIPFGYMQVAGNKKMSRNAGSLISHILSDNIAWHEKKGDMRLASVMSYYWSEKMPWQERGDFIDECVKKYIDTPYCGSFILLQSDSIDEVDVDDEEENNVGSALEKSNIVLKKRYALISDYLKRFPDCDNAKALENRLTLLGEEKISASLPQRLYPGESGKIKVSASNIFEFNILVVKLPSSYINKDIRLDAIKETGKVAVAIPVKFKGEKPVKFEQEYELPPLGAGVYVLVPSRNATLTGLITGTSPRMSLTTFTVSRLASFKTSDEASNGGHRLYIVDGKNQTPVAGAKVTLTPSYNNGTKKQKIEKITGNQGEVEVPDGSYSILVSKGVDKLSGDIWNGRFADRSENSQLLCRVFTDLSVYHPGDSVGFVGMLYEQKGRELKWMPDTKVNVKLNDANWQSVDTLAIVAERFGRVSGKFALPSSGRLGRYN
ncbi:MAG: hypothetical protein K2K97_00655, partial [Muribaculaceae bacterium]|nr:hypothetical protein [Muribaculaceae bacterium]